MTHCHGQEHENLGIRRSYRKVGLLAAALFMGGCTGQAPGPEPTESTVDPLWLTGTRWPGRSIEKICWSSSFVDVPNFAQYQTRFFQTLYRNWTHATGLRFAENRVGCDVDSPAVNGWMVVRLPDSGGSHAHVGYATQRPRIVTINRNASSFEQIVLHEVTHVLGFSHEMARPDFPDSGGCSDSNRSGNSVGTPPDHDSITASTYCQNLKTLSYWDIVGAQNAYGQPTRFADVDGDGRADAIVMDPNSPRLRVRLSTGSAFSSSELRFGYYPGTHGTFFADVDGDGRADLVRIEDDGVRVRRSNGTSFGADTVWAPQWLSERAIFVADVTGDGRADLIGISPSAITVRVSDGSRFASPTRTWLTNPLPGIYGTYFADVTGDGAADFVISRNNGFYVRVSNRSNGFGAEVLWAPHGWSGARGTFLADVDGDGAADLVALDEDGTTVHRSTGTAFSQTAERWSVVPSFRDRGSYMADVDGDGRADLVNVASTLLEVRRSRGTGFRPAENWYSGPFWSGEQPNL